MKESVNFPWKQESNVKEKGLDNNLLELIASDDAFNLSLEDLQKTMDPSKYVGRSNRTGRSIPEECDPADPG